MVRVNNIYIHFGISDLLVWVGRGFDYRSSTPLLKFSKNLGGKFGRLRASHGGHSDLIIQSFLRIS